MLTFQNLKVKSSHGQFEKGEMYKIPNRLDKKITITNNIIQLLHDNGLFDSFSNKDQVFAKYLFLREAYLLGKYG